MFPEFAPKEREVLTLIGMGLRNKDIAAQMGIAPATVGVTLMRVRIKLEKAGEIEVMNGGSVRGAIVRWAIQNGYAPLDRPRIF